MQPSGSDGGGYPSGGTRMDPTSRFVYLEDKNMPSVPRASK